MEGTCEIKTLEKDGIYLGSLTIGTETALFDVIELKKLGSRIQDAIKDLYQLNDDDYLADLEADEILARKRTEYGNKCNALKDKIKSDYGLLEAELRYVKTQQA